ncbi:AraC family transcriptional regulator [Taibaiella koreensis]|uniref:AraC family transcriptional regulator n=1 Tax=Taibaiella koreensis TaxID=1268548 RepID=UPI000E59B543|nr:helix-turn-helix transcriptional regulator [Taibaiella koreensis]
MQKPAPVLEPDQLVRFQTLERYASSFGSDARRLTESRWIYTLISIKQGKGHCFVDNEFVSLQAGTLLLINPFAYLHLENTVYVQGVVIHFTEEFLCRTHLYEQLLYKTIFGPNRRTCFQLAGNEIGGNYIQSQLSMFGWEYRLGADPLLKFDFLHNILLGVILYMHKLQLEQENATLDIKEPLAKNQVVQFIQLLNQHFREESSLQFYADKLNITQDQLGLICKKGVGWSPKAIMQEKLLREAKRALLFEPISVKEISFALGFTEPTNFVKFFQQHTGISPKNFRIENCIGGLNRQDSVA